MDDAFAASLVVGQSVGQTESPDEVECGADECAVVVPDGSVPEEDLEESVLAHVRRELGGFQVPKHVEIVDQLPTTATGKIQKASVRKMIARS